MRGLAGKHVVQAEVGRVEQRKHRRPAQVHARECPADGVREVRDDAQAVELPAHADEHREPKERVPGLRAHSMQMRPYDAYAALAVEAALHVWWRMQGARVRARNCRGAHTTTRLARHLHAGALSSVSIL